MGDNFFWILSVLDLDEQQYGYVINYWKQRRRNHPNINFLVRKRKQSRLSEAGKITLAQNQFSTDAMAVPISVCLLKISWNGLRSFAFIHQLFKWIQKSLALAFSLCNELIVPIRTMPSLLQGLFFPGYMSWKVKRDENETTGEKRVEEELENQHMRDDADNSVYFSPVLTRSTFSWSLPMKTNLENAGIRNKSRVTGSRWIRGDKGGRSSGALINKCRLVYRAFPYLPKQKKIEEDEEKEEKKNVTLTP